MRMRVVRLQVGIATETLQAALLLARSGSTDIGAGTLVAFRGANSMALPTMHACHRASAAVEFRVPIVDS